MRSRIGNLQLSRSRAFLKKCVQRMRVAQELIDAQAFTHTKLFTIKYSLTCSYHEHLVWVHLSELVLSAYQSFYCRMNAGPAGFHNAPVTKVVSFTCCVASIIIGMQGGVASCSLSYQAIVQKLHLWRLITSGFVFSSTPELMCGVYLLYYFRVLERQIGSNKHLVFVLFSMIFTTMCELISLVMFKDPISSGLAPGPYGLIFSSFVLFFYDIPVSKRFRIFNIQLSDKSFVYFAGLQLLLSSWKLSFIPGVCGVLAGFSYRLNVFCIRRIKFPEVVASTVARIFSPLLSRGQSNSGSRRNITTEIVNPTLGRQFQLPVMLSINTSTVPSVYWFWFRA